MLICVPSIAPMTLGKPLVASNPAHISETRSPVGYLIITGASSTSAFITRLVAYSAVLLPT